MAERLTLSIDEYHADRRWLTSTALKHAAKWTRDGILWTPSHLRNYLDGARATERSAPLEFGQCFHALAEGQSLYEIAVIMPEGMTRSMNSYKKEWRPAQEEKFGAEFVNKFELSWNDAKTLRGCWDSLRDSPAVRELLEQPKVAVEGVIRWDSLGLPTQVRPDLELEDDIPDWKTSADPHKFLRQVYDLGYHRSAGLQREGVYEASGKLKPVKHVVVGKHEPYDVVVYQLPERAFELGMRENRKLIKQVADWMDSGYWESAWERGVNRNDLPEWVYAASDEAAIDDEYGDHDDE